MEIFVSKKAKGPANSFMQHLEHVSQKKGIKWCSVKHSVVNTSLRTDVVGSWKTTFVCRMAFFQVIRCFGGEKVCTWLAVSRGRCRSRQWPLALTKGVSQK